MARMVPPTGIVLPRVSSGTAPGARVRPWAVAACRRHWRASKVIGAEAMIPPSPAVTA